MASLDLLISIREGGVQPGWRSIEVVRSHEAVQVRAISLSVMVPRCILDFLLSSHVSSIQGSNSVIQFLWPFWGGGCIYRPTGRSLMLEVT